MMLEKRRYFTANEVGGILIAAILAMYLFSYIASAIAQSITVNGIPFSETDAYYWISVVLSQGAILGAVLVACRITRVDYLQMTGLKSKLGAREILLLIPIAVVSIFAFGTLASLFVQLIESMGYTMSSGIASSPQYSSGFNFPIALLLVCVAPAICEESLFRGAFLSGVRRYGYIGAILLTGITFGVFHGNALQLVHQMLVGCLWAYVVIATRSMWAGVILHFLNNSISVVSSLVLEKMASLLDDSALSQTGVALEEELAGMETTVASVIVTLLISGVCCFILLLLLKAFTKQSVLRREKECGVTFRQFKNGYIIPTEETRRGFFEGTTAPQEKEENAAETFDAISNEDTTKPVATPSIAETDAQEQLLQDPNYVNNPNNKRVRRSGFFNSYPEPCPEITAKDKFVRLMSFLDGDEATKQSTKPHGTPIVLYVAWALIAALWILDFVLGILR